MAQRILIVDDEPSIVDMLEYNLKRANYDVVVARDGEEALRLARETAPDLIVLDLMLPKLDGIEVCRALRREAGPAQGRDVPPRGNVPPRRGGVPIIMLTARDSEVDRVVGLELGADDYVVKPFSVRELMARIKSVLRRAAPPESQAAAGDQAVWAGPLHVDAGRYEAAWDGVALDLTTLEFELLHTLARHAGRVLSREQLVAHVWGYDYFGDLRVVDAAVKRLRAKLREAAPEAEPIETVRGVGYKLVVG